MSSDNSANTQQIDLLLIRTLIDKYNKSQASAKQLKQSITELEQEHAQLKQTIGTRQQDFDSKTNELKKEQAKAIDTLKSEYQLMSEQTNISSQKKVEQLSQELAEIKASYSAIITRIRGE